MKYEESLNGIWAFYPDYEPDERRERALLDIREEQWQPIPVPAVWEGNFQSPKEGTSQAAEKLLRVRINGGAWQTVDLEPYCDGKAQWVAIPVKAGILREGDNEIEFDSTSKNYGIDSDESLEMFGTAKTEGSCSFFSQDLITWHPLPDRAWNIRIEAGSAAREAVAETARFRTDCQMSIGLNAMNGTPNYLKKIIALEGHSAGDEARLLVHVRAGPKLSGSTDDYGDTRKFDGVGWYRRKFRTPHRAPGDIVWLTFRGADYYAEVWVNGTYIGDHEGGYTPFRFDLSTDLPDLLNDGADNELIIRVTDQSDPRCASGTGKFPIKETLAGFLQDSVGVNYGGLWHDVELSVGPSVFIEDVFIEPDVDGGRAIAHATLRNKSAAPVDVRLGIRVPGGEPEGVSSAVAGLRLKAGGREVCVIPVELIRPRLWSIDDPYLYTAELSLSTAGTAAADRRNVFFGMRKIEAEGGKFLLNGVPLQLTGMIHWGMYLDRLSVRPDREQVRKEIADLKEAGFNSVKFTLFDPPCYVLDEFDRLGMYAYIEYPIWNPIETPAFFDRARKQIREMLVKDRNHPSVILTDFNCEMHFFSEEMDKLMRELVDAGKELAPNRLYLDNSGNGVTRYGDFYALHPYFPLKGFRETIGEHVARREKEADKPLVLGEFADTDTIRDTSAVRRANGGELPWWWSFFRVADPEAILRKQGYAPEQIERFKRTSRQHALMAKKYYMEGAKFYDRIGALYLTHLNDIPTTQPGFYDDNFEPKFDPLELRKFAAASVLLLERTTQNFFCGTEVRVTPFLSHYGSRPLAGARLEWQLVRGEDSVAAGTSACGIIANGGLTPLSPIVFEMPQLPAPCKLRLIVLLREDATEFTVTNDWDLWAYPNKALLEEEAGGFSLGVHDPGDSLSLLVQYPWAKPLQNEAGDTGTPSVLISTEWNQELEAYARAGARVLYVGHQEALYPIKPGGFNAYSYAVVPEPHDAMGDFPHDGYSDLQFLELASTYYMETKIPSWESVEDKPPEAPPILARIDLRSYAAGAYIAERKMGDGLVMQTTLAHGGNDAAGRYLLDQLLRYLISPGAANNTVPPNA